MAQCPLFKAHGLNGAKSWRVQIYLKKRSLLFENKVYLTNIHIIITKLFINIINN